MRIVCCETWSLTGTAIVRSVSKHAGNLYLDMASDLGEEMDTEIEISGDIRNLLPRDGSVNAYGSHLAENEGEQNEDDGARRSESRETEVVCFAYIFQTIFEFFFVLYNLNTGH